MSRAHARETGNSNSDKRVLSRHDNARRVEEARCPQLYRRGSANFRCARLSAAYQCLAPTLLSVQKNGTPSPAIANFSASVSRRIIAVRASTISAASSMSPN